MLFILVYYRCAIKQPIRIIFPECFRRKRQFLNDRLLQSPANRFGVHWLQSNGKNDERLQWPLQRYGNFGELEKWAVGFPLLDYSLMQLKFTLMDTVKFTSTHTSIHHPQEVWKTSKLFFPRVKTFAEFNGNFKTIAHIIWHSMVDTHISKQLFPDFFSQTMKWAIPPDNNPFM